MNILSLFDGMSCGQIALNRLGIDYDKYYAAEVDKYAIKVTQANYPETIQLGDVNNWREWDIDWSSIDLLLGGSPCFVKGTPVVCMNDIKGVESVQVGDLVLTHNNRYKKVLRTGGEKKRIYSLVSQGSTPTETTSNHPYYVRKRNRVWDNSNRTYKWVFDEPKWVSVENISKGDYVGTPILNTSINNHNLSEDECFVLGVYIGDGHTRKDYRTSENRKNHRYWQLILSVGSHKLKSFKDKIKIKHSAYRHTKNVHRVVFSSKRLVEISEKYCGVAAGNKHFSKMLLDLPNDLLKKVIEGYEFADGSFRKNTYRATTISKKLVQSLSLAVAKVYQTTCCIEHTKRPEKTVIEGRVVNQKNTWTISYRKEHKKQSRAWVLDGVVWNPVKEVSKTKKLCTVYNIEVEDDNSYIANNHIVHNCQGFSFAGNQLAFDDPRSKLFFVYVDILNHIREHNQNVKFLLENVRMKKEYLAIISKQLGVEPVMINSSLVSAQNRVRYYWANWEFGQPCDEGKLLKDIVHENEKLTPLTDKGINYMLNGNEKWGQAGKCRLENYTQYKDKKAFTVTHNIHKGVPYNCYFEELNEYIVPFDKTLQILDKEVERGKVGYFRKDSHANRVYYIHGKAVTLLGSAGGGAAKMGQYLFGCITPSRINKRQNGQRFNEGKKFYTLTAQDQHEILIEGYIRKLTPVECERLQTVPDNCTNHVSNTQRYKMLGNGWTVDVICHILKSMSTRNEY